MIRVHSIGFRKIKKTIRHYTSLMKEIYGWDFPIAEGRKVCIYFLLKLSIIFGFIGKQAGTELGQAQPELVLRFS